VPEQWLQSNEVTPDFLNSRVLPGQNSMRGAKARDFATDSPEFGVRSTHRVRTQCLSQIFLNDLNVALFDIVVELIEWHEHAVLSIFLDFE
jgi:hypothetical protein